MECIKKEKRATEASTWDGRYLGYMSPDHLSTMARWICIIGPLGAMYGRDIEQYLMQKDRISLIPEWEFNNSVDGVKWTLNKNALTKYYYQESNQSETSSARWDRQW